MEHYVLCVWNGAFTDEDHVLVTNYLDSLFPSVHQHAYTADFSEEVAILLKPVSKYIAIINTFQESENVNWEDFIEDLSIKDLISRGVNSANSSESISKDVIELISVSLHTLADQLPPFGTYKLDVLVGSNVLKDLSVSKEPLLSSAFFRLMRWHSAYFTIFIQEELDRDRLNEWCEIINADVLHSNSKFELGPLLWRGDMQCQSSDDVNGFFCQGFELNLDLIDNEDKIFFYPVNEDAELRVPEHIVLSSKLQVVDEISFASIPPYMISSVSFRLHLGKPNVLNEKSSYLVQYLLSNKEVALIARLGYAELNEKITPERKYCTSKWQKAVASGCFKDPECFVSTFKNYITFAVTKSNNSDYILAYPLKDKKSLNANFYFSIINCKAFSLSSHVSERTNETEENILSEVPFIKASLFHEILKKYTKQKVHLLKSGSSLSEVENISNLWENISNLSTCSISLRANALDLVFEEIDPSDWPERIQLLCKQMQNEETCSPENSLPGQGFKLPQQSFSVSNEDISQYFLPSGELKNSENIDVLYPLNNINHFVKQDFDTILHMEWPEVINCRYPDIYYNSSCQIEDKESLGSQMIKLYIQHETASTCNKQQITQKFSIIVPERNTSPYKEFRSPSCRSTNAVHQRRSKRESVTIKENTTKDLLTKKILSTSKSLYSQSTTNKETREKPNVISGTSKTNVKSKCSNSPVRRSPRKKTPVNYKYPSVNRNTDPSQNASDQKSNKMSDMLRKKIRNAVAIALGNHGINLNHPFYQPCGSKLFAICRTFVQDLPLKKGTTSEYLQKIADAHVKQVIDFYKE